MSAWENELIRDVTHRLSGICHSYSGGLRVLFEVLDAIHKPTEGMKDAGTESFGPMGKVLTELGQPTKCWQAMIDALKVEVEAAK